MKQQLKVKKMILKIRLGDNYSHYEKGIVMFDEYHREELQYYVHQGMFVDTLLLGTAKEMTHGEFLLRWRIKKNGIEIYDIAPEVTQIFWVNSSKKHISIDKYEPIAPGGTFIIRLS